MKLMSDFKPNSIAMTVNDDGTYCFTYRDVAFKSDNTDEIIIASVTFPRVKVEWTGNAMFFEYLAGHEDTDAAKEIWKMTQVDDSETKVDNQAMNVDEQTISPIVKTNDCIEPIQSDTHVSSCIKNCMDCPAHEVQADPDRDDSFCYDDKKVICKVNHREVTYACRPHHLREECKIPDWCPLK